MQKLLEKLNQELKDLNGKIERARAAINNEKLAISTRQKQLIIAQIAAMTSYSSILEMRIEDLNRDDDLRKFDD